MKSTYDQQSRKRTDNTALNEDVALKAHATKDNLLRTVELAPKDLGEQKNQQHLAESRILETTIATWNDFDGKVGSLADEHSPPLFCVLAHDLPPRS